MTGKQGSLASTPHIQKMRRPTERIQLGPPFLHYQNVEAPCNSTHCLDQLSFQPPAESNSSWPNGSQLMSYKYVC